MLDEDIIKPSDQECFKSGTIRANIISNIPDSTLRKEMRRRWDKVVNNRDEKSYFVTESCMSRIGDKQSRLWTVGYSHALDKLAQEFQKDSQSLHETDHYDPLIASDLFEIIRETVTDEKSCKRFIEDLEYDVEFLSILNDCVEFLSILHKSSKYGQGCNDIEYIIKAVNESSVRRSLLAAYRKWGKSENYSSMVLLLIVSFKIFITNECMDQFNRIMFGITEMINKGESLDKIKDELLVEYDHGHTNPNI